MWVARTWDDDYLCLLMFYLYVLSITPLITGCVIAMGVQQGAGAQYPVLYTMLSMTGYFRGLIFRTSEDLLT